MLYKFMLTINAAQAPWPICYCLIQMKTPVL